MAKSTKIATCCFCGARAALTLSGTTRHELACSSCGAPLHDLKKLPSAATAKHKVHKPKAAVSHLKPVKQKKVKKRKSVWGSLLSEAVDLLEDVFD